MRKQKGITLIALVITIIVLLILAGVSIATLTGENGILSKADTAKKETTEAGAKEKIQVEVLGSYDNNGKLIASNVIANITKNIPEAKIEGKDFPLKVTLDGYTFEIDEKGNVTLAVPGPKVEDSIDPKTQINKGEKITITIKATPVEGTTITKIILPDGTEVKNVNEATYEVTDNGDYEFTVEGSNKGKTVHKVTITNGIEVEKFSDIYEKTETYTDKNGKTARIPQGFAVGESSTINTIDGGLVITDSIDANHKSIGNEFVWIPVDNADEFKTFDGYASENKQTYITNKNCTEPYINGSQEEKDLYNAMKNSVTNSNNKGFYIGRYEAGKENNKVVVKKNMPVYNNIGWSNSDTMTVLTGGAVELAKNFVKTTYTDKNKTVGVTSTLVYGVQWDATLRFFNDEAFFKNSTGKGWYSDNYNTGNLNNKTGIDVDEKASNKVKNIYDMAGNVSEWTMEAYDTSIRVSRGGSYGTDSVSGPVSYRGIHVPTSRIDYIGFRLALYVNI